MKKVTVLGSGAWGTAFSTLLAHNGYTVKLWCHEAEVAADIQKNQVNSSYLPSFILDKKIEATDNLQTAFEDSSIIFEVIPVKFLRQTLESAKPYYKNDQIWVILSKGIEQKSLLLPTDVLDDVFGIHHKKATLSGPNFAHDFAEKTYTATTIASKDLNIGKMLHEILANEYFKPYLSVDIEGVQVGGAIKNAITLLIGIAKGAGCKDNTIAYLITKGMSEMAQIAKYYGGQPQTIYGLSGLGDLLLTAMGPQSRNLKVGMMIGQGMKIDKILETTGIIPEGLNTIESLWQLIEQNNINLLLCKSTYEIIFKGKKITDLLHELMNEPLTYEQSL